MTSKLLTLSFTLLAATAAFADDCCPEPVCPPPCEPCCVPQPKKCIDMEAYLHPWYDMQCNVGMFVDAEFLYWYGREYDVYAIEGQVVDVTNNPDSPLAGVSQWVPTSDITLNAEWKPGFRIGLGYEDDCDGWDYYLNWTWYKNRSHSHASVTPFTGVTADVGGFALASPFVDLDILHNLTQELSDVPDFESISAKYSLTFNRVDLELGRRYWVSKCFTMRPYVGLRGEWLKSRLKVLTQRSSLAVDSTTISLDLSNKLSKKPWGAGFFTGFQPAWFFTREFSIFGNLDVGLVWGKKKSNSSSNFAAGTTTVSILDFGSSEHADYSGMMFDLDLAIGLRWEDSWCEDQYRFAIDAGWEHHYTRTGSPDFSKFAPSLQMGGFVLRARFDF